MGYGSLWTSVTNSPKGKEIGSSNMGERSGKSQEGKWPNTTSELKEGMEEGGYRTDVVKAQI